MVRKFAELVGGEAAVAALSVGTPAPYFLACGGLFTNQAIYRVSWLGPSLLGLRVGEGSTEDPKRSLDIPSHKDLMTANRELAKIHP